MADRRVYLAARVRPLNPREISMGAKRFYLHIPHSHRTACRPTQRVASKAEMQKRLVAIPLRCRPIPLEIPPRLPFRRACCLLHLVFCGYTCALPRVTMALLVLLMAAAWLSTEAAQR